MIIQISLRDPVTGKEVLLKTAVKPSPETFAALFDLLQGEQH